MNTIKRYLGVIWMLLGPASIVYGIMQAMAELSPSAKTPPTQETYTFWIIIIAIFVPIAVGMSLMGYYAWHGDYDHLDEERGIPEN
ncbi:MAG: DUF6814 family protein [Saprospiraceae bacterium]